MKRLTLLACLLAIVTVGFAQMQSGYVKTRGRQAADGSTIHGTRLAGATLSLKGRKNAVGSDKNGVFKFDTKGRPFCLTGVQKQGYQICDRDLLGKTFRHSANEFIVVMDTPENIKTDRLNSEDDIREQLQSRLKAKQEEIKRLRNQQKISEAKYNELRQQLYDEQRMNEKIITEMAERYATLDFDQLDDFQRQLEFLIRTGELRRADSLIATKGSMAERSAELDRMDEAIKKDAEDITRRQELHDKSVAMRNKKLEDFAADCYNRYKICLLSHKTDSAAYWLELRASKDTTNVDWQLEAGKFMCEYWAHYDDALRYFERALAGAEKDKSQEDVAICYNNIGTAYRYLDQYDKALEYYQKALDIDLEVLGEKHTVALCYNNIGTTYHSLGQYDKALEYYQEALDINLEVLGEKHIVALCYNSIGTTYHSLGQYDKALEYYQEALDIDLEILGEKHKDVAACYNNIGASYRYLDQYDKALEYNQKALDISLEVLGEKHTNVATCYNNIGHSYLSLGQYDKALEYYQEALDINLEVLGEKHTNVATYYNNIGHSYQSLGQYDKALEYNQKALDIYLEVLGEKHKDVATCHNNIGLTYQSLGQYDKALEYLQKALDIDLEILGEKHTDVAAYYNNIGLTYQSLGQYDKALEYLQKALDIYLEVFGEKHKDVATGCGYIGLAYHSLGQYDKALEYFQKALDIALEINHPDTELFNQSIAYNYWAAKAKGIELEGFKEFIAPRVFMATTIGKDTPEAAKGMDGTYAVLEYNDWTIDSDESLLLAGQAANGQPKTIVVMKAGHISQYHFENNIGVQFNYVNVGEQEKERILKAYKNWKASTKR